MPSGSKTARFLFVLTACMAPAWAQVSTASINGTVQDSSGARIRGAAITATQVDTGAQRKSTSGEDGGYTLTNLPVGGYTLEVSSTGFAPFRQTGIVLNVGESATAPVVLKVGNVNEAVTVSADAAIVNATESSLSRLIDTQQVAGLPLNGRNPATLVFLAGGVSNPIQNIPITNTGSPILQNSLVFPTEIAPTSHGVRGGGVYFSLDGANNVDPFNVAGGPFPNPDATEEFSVVTSTYGSRYVSAPGGAVNIVTKSGTNAWHGDLFEFLRNGDLNARNFFAADHDLLKRNQFGGTLGLPILKNRWFVFGSYQGTRLSNQTSGLVSFVPTPAERTGNFSALGKAITDPLTGAQFSGNVIPASRLDPTMQKLLAFIPNSPSPDGKIVYSQPIQQQEDQYVVKSDFLLSQNHRIFGRYFYDTFNWDPEAIPGGNIIASYRGQVHYWHNATFGDTYTRGNLVSEFRFGFIRDNSITVAGESTVSLAGLGAKLPEGQFPTIQSVTASGYFSIVPGNYNGDPRNTYDIAEDVNWIRGRHQISFGAEVQRISIQLKTDNQQNPVVTYNGSITGNALSDFILGTPGTFNQSDGIFIDAQGTLQGFYGEDKIRLGRRLTLTAGLRWDPYWPYHSVGGRITCFRPGEQSKVFTNAPAGLVFPGDPGCSAAGTNSNLANFEPRFGFAQQLDAGGKTVVRGGYGLYTTEFPLASFLGFGQVQPFVRSFSLTAPGSITDPWAAFPGGDPFASGFQLNLNPRPASTPFINPGLSYSFVPNFKLGYAQQWNMTLERALGANDVVEVSYVGTKGTHLSLIADANQPIYIPGQSTQGNTQARRPYAAIGKLNTERSDGTSIYNGLEVNYRHRLRAGFTLVSSFTYSRSIDQVSSPANVLLTGGGLIPNPNNFQMRRGPSDFDQPYTWRTSGVWNVPYRANPSGWEKALLAGWELDTIFTYEAGFPFSVTAPFNNSFTGNGLDFPDLVAGQRLTLSGDRPKAARIAQWFNTAAFQPNAPGTFGNAGRNIIRSPGLVNVDTSLVKSIPVTERFRVLFRSEFFNVLNHANFLPPNSALGQGGFGQIIGARDPRILQFSLKLVF